MLLRIEICEKTSKHHKSMISPRINQDLGVSRYLDTLLVHKTPRERRWSEKVERRKGKRDKNYLSYFSPFLFFSFFFSCFLPPLP